jgi:hypothetical protein
MSLDPTRRSLLGAAMIAVATPLLPAVFAQTMFGEARP